MLLLVRFKQVSPITFYTPLLRLSNDLLSFSSALREVSPAHQGLLVLVSRESSVTNPGFVPVTSP